MAESSRNTPRRHRKLTPKQRVLKKMPLAFSKWNSLYGQFFILNGTNDVMIGVGDTPQKAWADAARFR